MTFEDTLRDQLHRQAADLPLPDREPARAVARARTRRRNHRVAAGATAVIALLAVAVVPQLAGGDDGDDSLTAGAAGEGGLPPTGPLTFDWQATEGGLTSVSSTFQTDDGTIYALATGPGVRYDDHPNGDYPRALYRLAEDGTWEAVPLEGERPDAVDVTTAGGLLYAVSTGPDGNGGYGPMLSTSADGGDTWTVEDVGTVDPPSDVISWLKSSTLAIESSGDTTLALVSTGFRPNQEEVFPQLREPGAYIRYQAEVRPEGLALLDVTGGADPTRPPPEDLAAAAAQAHAAFEDAQAAGDGTRTWAAEPPPTAPASTDPTVTVPPSAVEATMVPPAEGEPPAIWSPFAGAEVVQVVPWADLGVSGIEALGGHHQVFQRTDEGWAQLDVTGLPADVLGLELTAAGGRFVATGYTMRTGGTTAYASSDGATWSPVASPDPQVVGVESALVSLPYEGTVVHVSPDGGATWSAVDLASFGVAPDWWIADVDAGPLGLALLMFPANGAPGGQLVASGDLVDWTVTPMEDIVGVAGHLGGNVVVGADRVVVTASIPPADPTAALPATVTAVGTPIRQD